MLTYNTNKAFNCNRPTLYSAEAFFCCREDREKEKESARGTMGKGKREERPFLTFSLVPRPLRAFYFFIIAILGGIPSGSLCGGERMRHYR